MLTFIGGSVKPGSLGASGDAIVFFNFPFMDTGLSFLWRFSLCLTLLTGTVS